MRASHRANLGLETLAGLCRAHFEAGTIEEGSVRSAYGAISRLSARGEGRQLVVELLMDPKVPEDVARETIGRYNRFLEETTGYSSKERARRLKKEPAG